MKNLSGLYHKEGGFGLLEVLITTVVVAFGLLAVGAMQGGFMSSSSDLKARSEALKLAEAKIEEFRNQASKADYDAIASSTSNESVNGVNAAFSRSWTVTPDSAPDRRKITVAVAWGAGGADETVNLTSQITFSDASKSVNYATGGNGLSGQAPSPNNVSSVVSDVKFKSSDINDVSLNDGSGLSQYTDSDGDTYLVKPTTPDADGNDLQAVIKFQGGVILSIKGAVYLGTVGTGATPTVTLTATADYPIAFSDLAYCVFPVPSTTSDYICYFGGDCTDGGNGCPADISEFDAVQGGWYGRVGLIETASANFQNKKVCFGEDVAGTGIETAATTARTYVTRVVDASNDLTGSQGINQSFECQNFLIVEKRGSSYPCSTFSDYTIPSTSNKLAIASSSVERVLSESQQNTVLVPNASQCGATTKYVVTGSITGTEREQVSVVIDRNACLVSVSNDVYTYICTIETTSSSTTITALGGGASPATQTISLSASQITGAEIQTGPNSQLNDCSAPWGATINNNASVTAYQAESVPTGNSCVSEQRDCSQGALSGSYVYETCTVENSGNCITPWNEIVTDGGSVTAYSAATVTSPTTCASVSETRACTSGTLSGTFTNQTCSVQSAASTCSVMIAGNILKGSGNTAKPSDNSVTVSASPGGACAKASASGNAYSYTCDVGTLSTGSSVAITGANVTGGGAVTVDCLSQSTVTINGPDLTTQ